MGLKADSNISSFRRLGKSLPDGSTERRKCRPILVTTNSKNFLDRCFARSHHLKTFRLPIYIKKALSPAERETEKQLLAKRHELIQNGGKLRENFRIKKLQLFYDGVLVPITSP